MTSVQQSTLSVPGASLFYRSCGRGAPLLILAGAGTDSDMTDPLRDRLAARHRVITYDRRGLSRSKIDPGVRDPDIETHADDAHGLLAALTDEPAYVFAAGFGGLVGLDLLARYPEQVRRLVVHEAPAPELLSPDEAEALRDAQQRVLTAFRAGGVTAALKEGAELAGSDPEDREPDIAPPAVTPQREQNLVFDLSCDAPRARGYRLDIPALDVQARKIVPAAGRSTRRTLPHRSALALAEILERPLVEFPGGHTSWLLRPRAVAALLLETFEREPPTDRRLRDVIGWRAGQS